MLPQTPADDACMDGGKSTSKKKSKRQLSAFDLFLNTNKRKAARICMWLIEKNVMEDCDDMASLEEFVGRALRMEEDIKKEVMATRDLITGPAMKINKDLTAELEKQLREQIKEMAKDKETSDELLILKGDVQEQLNGLLEQQLAYAEVRLKMSEKARKDGEDTVKFTDDHEAGMAIMDKQTAKLTALIKKWEGRREHGRGTDECFCQKCAFTCF